MAKIIRLTEKDLASIIRRVISEQNDATIKQIQTDFVDKEKISQEDADVILSIPAKGKYLMWLAKMVANGAVQSSEIKSFDKYFKAVDDANKPNMTDEYKDIFRNKGIFTDSFNIPQLKKDEVARFVEACEEFNKKRAELGLGSEGGKGLLNPKKIAELRAADIKLIGVVDDYQIFKVSSTSDETFNTYRSILLNCGGEKIPSSRDPSKMVSVNLCTAGRDHFDRYLKTYPGSSYYNIFNLEDHDAPYQFHYESNEFKNRENKEIF